MNILDILKAILYGIVEGITEWLPVSSTGHMILVNQFVQFRSVSSSFFPMFEVVIQFGAILAVVVLFWHKLWPFGMEHNRPVVKADIFSMWLKILVACVPAAVVGVLFDDKIDALFYHPVPVALALIIVGVLFILVENYNRNRHPHIRAISEITYQDALIIGIFQLLAAVFPGTSRSGATIIGALLIGVSRKTAAEFTFFLAVPVMLGASLLKMAKFGLHFTPNEAVVLLTGMIVAFFISVVVIRFLMSYIKKHDFKAFGWYRIALGILVMAYFLL